VPSKDAVNGVAFHPLGAPMLALSSGTRHVDMRPNSAAQSDEESESEGRAKRQKQVDAGSTVSHKISHEEGFRLEIFTLSLLGVSTPGAQAREALENSASDERCGRSPESSEAHDPSGPDEPRELAPMTTPESTQGSPPEAASPAHPPLAQPASTGPSPKEPSPKEPSPGNSWSGGEPRDARVGVDGAASEGPKRRAWAAMTVVALKAELTNLGERTSGNKKALVERLEALQPLEASPLEAPPSEASPPAAPTEHASAEQAVGARLATPRRRAIVLKDGSKVDYESTSEGSVRIGRPGDPGAVSLSHAQWALIRQAVPLLASPFDFD